MMEEQAMDTSTLVGWALIGAAATDLVLAAVLIPRAPTPQARVILTLALPVSALAMTGFGIALLAGWIAL